MNLKQARHKSGLNQNQLARMLDTSQTLVSFWESGIARPSNQQVEKMNKIFPHAVDWDMEFAPLDLLEQRAALRLAAYLSKEVDETSAAKLVFENTKYDLRKLLKASGYLPINYSPGDDVLLPRT